MATKRTRLKERKASQSTGRSTVTGQAKWKIAAASTAHKSHARIVKRAPEKTSPMKVTTRRPRAQQETSASSKKLKTEAGTNRKTTPKDEYDFDESDDFLSGNSFLSAPFSASGSKKVAKSGALSNVKSSESNRANRQKGKQQKPLRRNAGSEESKKKTSTPLSDAAPGRRPDKSQAKRRQYLQISMPKLDLDVDVTPILPISANQSTVTRTSPRQKANKSSDAKSVSFKADLKEAAPTQTPAGKINHEKTQRQLAVAQNLSSFSASGGFKEPTPITIPDSVATSYDAASRKADRKRKNPEPDGAYRTSTSAKRKKTASPESTQSLPASKKKGPSQKVSSSARSNSTKKQTRVRQTELELGSDSRKGRHVRQRKPVTSTPLSHPEEEQREDKEAVQHDSQHDSGISMGNDLSPSGDINQTSASSLPGFMEEESLYTSPGFLEISPLAAPSSSSKEEPALYKSAAKEYKPTKTKREKGRFSTSKMLALTKKINISFREIEDFELVVESE